MFECRECRNIFQTWEKADKHGKETKHSIKTFRDFLREEEGKEARYKMNEHDDED